MDTSRSQIGQIFVYTFFLMADAEFRTSLAISAIRCTHMHLNVHICHVHIYSCTLTLTPLNATECTNSKKLLQIVALSRQGMFARLTHPVAFSRRGVCYTTWILLRNSRIPHCILLHLAWFMFRNTAFCCI